MGARYDVEAVRGHFPALSEGAAHFDGPGGSQVPLVVGQAVAGALTSAVANRGQVTAAERRADGFVSAGRASLADLLGADPGGVVFGRSMTQITYDVSRAIAKGWGPGDEIVVTRLDHDANVRPWVQAAEAVGASVRWAGFDPVSTELTSADIDAVLSPRTRLVAVTASSNLLGTRPPIAEIADLVHRCGALLYVDGVHFTAHAPVDLAALGADFFVFSPYKLLGPHCGVLAASPQLLETLRPDKLAPATDAVPERFEFGTLPYELMAGCTAAVDFIAGLTPDQHSSRRENVLAGMQAIEDHENALLSTLEAGLAELPGLVVHSQAAHRTPTLLLSVPGRAAFEVQVFLAERGVNAPAGSFYALETSRWMGLGDTGALRVGLAPYTNDEDVERLLTGLADFLKSS